MSAPLGLLKVFVDVRCLLQLSPLEVSLAAAVHEVARIGAATETEMAQVSPPTSALLP